VLTEEFGNNGEPLLDSPEAIGAACRERDNREDQYIEEHRKNFELRIKIENKIESCRKTKERTNNGTTILMVNTTIDALEWVLTQI
jgi:hypothetical protein